MAQFNNSDHKVKPWQSKLHEIIYEADTPAGKLFDVVLLFMIVFSVGIVMIDSIPEYHRLYGDIFYIIEWIVTIAFTIEYILRIISISRPLKYVVSFLGIIDLLSILPAFLSLIISGSQTLLIVRALRLFRIFRIFKLQHYLSEMRFLSEAMVNSLRKISIFLLFVVTLVIIMGSIMYLVEDPSSGFTSIPQSVYWAIVTITTVGYGDISPVTPLGKLIASFIMLMGYGIIAVPTGIVTTEMAITARNRKVKHDVCPSCGKEGHDDDATYCKICSAPLSTEA